MFRSILLVIRSPILRQMHFISIAFWLFLPTVLVMYWLLQGRLRAQNALLLVASYFFYGW